MGTVEKPPFLSLRWRLTLPLFGIALVVATLGAFVLGQNLGGSFEGPQMNLLRQSSQGISTQAAVVYERDRTEAQRIAFTAGVAEAAVNRSANDLQPILESSARLAGLDSVAVTDVAGMEILGLRRTQQGEVITYAISVDTDLRLQSVVRSVLDEGFVGASGLLQTPSGVMVYTAVPLTSADTRIGVVLVGRQLDTLLAELKTYGAVELALYGSDGALMDSTVMAAGQSAETAQMPISQFQEALTASDNLMVRTVNLNSAPYQAAYFPLRYGPETLGVLGAFALDSVPAMTQSGRQLTGLVLATLTAAVLVGLFVALNYQVIFRLAQVSTVAQALSKGELSARTQMQPTDELGAAGHALDQFALAVQKRQDAMRLMLRRQRREAEYLMNALEALPDGVVVQDAEGRVMVMNERARDLLGSQPDFSSTELDQLKLAFPATMGTAVAPGLYLLGDPRRLERNGRLLNAQAAALTNFASERVGTVFLMRDVTHEVRREQMHELLLKRLEQDVQTPLSSVVRQEALTYPLSETARSLSRHAVALQKLIGEMREMTLPDMPSLREQRPLHLDTLVWRVANEWRQVAIAAGLTLEVTIEKRGLWVLGDERRLRWAIGNLLDNAIKYTLPGGKLTLEVNGEHQGSAMMRVRDNGVGILADELPHVFTRYFRGTPTTPDGQIIRVPGMGQGLTSAKQIFDTHGGQIQIKSRPGVGSAVYFLLPLTAGIGYELPQFEGDSDALEGETVRLPEKQPLNRP